MNRILMLFLLQFACLLLNGCSTHVSNNSGSLDTARQILTSANVEEQANRFEYQMLFAAHDISFLAPGRISGVEWALLTLMYEGKSCDAILAERFISSSYTNVRRCAIASYVSISSRSGDTSAALRFATDSDIEVRRIVADIMNDNLVSRPISP